jgi:hypothetical protein
MRRAYIVGLLFLALTQTGCGPKPPETIPVTGLVTLDGQPCPSAGVTFIPQGDTQGRGGMGQTDGAGRFTVHLDDGKSAHGPAGLLAGNYKVLISKLVNPDGTPFQGSPDVAPIDSNARETLPEKYSHYEQTTLSANIQPPSQDLKFELQSSSTTRR